jgi:hypothetical protein
VIALRDRISTSADEGIGEDQADVTITCRAATAVTALARSQ